MHPDDPLYFEDSEMHAYIVATANNIAEDAINAGYSIGLSRAGDGDTIMKLKERQLSIISRRIRSLVLDVKDHELPVVE